MQRETREEEVVVEDQAAEAEQAGEEVIPIGIVTKCAHISRAAIEIESWMKER